MTLSPFTCALFILAFLHSFSDSRCSTMNQHEGGETTSQRQQRVWPQPCSESSVGREAGLTVSVSSLAVSNKHTSNCFTALLIKNA